MEGLILTEEKRPVEGLLQGCTVLSATCPVQRFSIGRLTAVTVCGLQITPLSATHSTGVASNTTLRDTQYGGCKQHHTQGLTLRGLQATPHAGTHNTGVVSNTTLRDTQYGGCKQHHTQGLTVRGLQATPHAATDLHHSALQQHSVSEHQRALPLGRLVDGLPHSQWVGLGVCQSSWVASPFQRGGAELLRNTQRQIDI
jgi:hypothetical protein